MEFKPCSQPKSCFTASSDTACVDLFSHKQCKHNTSWRTLIHHIFKRMAVTPSFPFMHHFSLYILPLIILRINILEKNRRHIYTVDISTSKWKTSWTEHKKKNLKMRLLYCEKLYFKVSAPLFSGVCVTPVLQSCSLAFFKVILTIWKSKISHQSVFLCNLMMF